MKNGGIDKRVIKTKNAIFEAFKQLVQEKDMSDITISELTQKANITRSTFYMYYNTVGDVRTDIENTIMARIDRIMSETDIRNSIRKSVSAFEHACRRNFEARPKQQIHPFIQHVGTTHGQNQRPHR